MKKVIFFICFALIQLVPISASAQKNKPFDYSYLDAGFSEGMKSGVHIIVLQDPIAVKNTICVSEEMEGPPNYRSIAILGALLSDDHFKVTGSSPDAGYARQRSMLVWYPSIKFNRIMKRENIKDLKIYREYSCNTFILIDEDYMSVKSVLQNNHAPTKNGRPFYFEKSYSFNESLNSMSKYLGYSDSSHYENGFMKFNPYANNIAYKAFERIDMISEVEIKKLIDRANAVGYSLVDYGFIHPMTALNFILEERTAAKNGTSLADAVIEKNKRSEEAAWVLKNPHVLKCGSTVDCGDARDIIAKMGDAVIKLVEAGKTNGKYSYKTPSSKLDSQRRITQCNDAYNKAKRLSVNVGDLMGQRDYLLSQCNLANIMY